MNRVSTLRPAPRIPPGGAFQPGYPRNSHFVPRASGTLITFTDASGGSGGDHGTGGGLYIGGGTTTLTGKTKVAANFASTSNNNIYGTFSI
jgi:hypothetical protein